MASAWRALVTATTAASCGSPTAAARTGGGARRDRSERKAAVAEAGAAEDDEEEPESERDGSEGWSSAAGDGAMLDSGASSARGCGWTTEARDPLRSGGWLEAMEPGGVRRNRLAGLAGKKTLTQATGRSAEKT